MAKKTKQPPPFRAERAEDPLHLTYRETLRVGVCRTKEDRQALLDAIRSRSESPLDRLEENVRVKLRALKAPVHDPTGLYEWASRLDQFSDGWWAIEVWREARRVRERLQANDARGAVDQAVRLGALAAEADLYRQWGENADRGQRSSKGSSKGGKTTAEGTREEREKREAKILWLAARVHEREPSLRGNAQGTARRIVKEDANKGKLREGFTVEQVRAILRKRAAH